MTKYPKITIITAVFNAEDTLENTIKSVIKQSYSNIEYIIIDGGSTDNTLNIIRKYKAYISYWMSEPDTGIYDAWNKGIIKSSGDWISFLGGDDQLKDEHTQKYVHYILKSTKELNYIMSKVDLIDKDGKYIRTIGKPFRSWNNFKKRMTCIHTGSMHSKNYFETYGLFNTNYKIVGDYELLLRSKEKLIAGYIDESTVNMQIGGVSDSPKVHRENIKAKIQTAGRNKYVVYIEEFIYYTKSLVRKKLY